MSLDTPYLWMFHVNGRFALAMLIAKYASYKRTFHMEVHFVLMDAAYQWAP